MKNTTQSLFILIFLSLSIVGFSDETGLAVYKSMKEISIDGESTTVDDLPLAKLHNLDTKFGIIEPIDQTAAILDAFNTVKPLKNGTIPDRDNASDMSKLGYVTNKIETKYFGGYIGTHLQKTTGYMSVIVDDEAEITIKEFNEGSTSGASKTFKVGKGALWRPAYYTIIPMAFEPKKTYAITVKYKNTAALKHPDGKVDVDGISLYYFYERYEQDDEDKLASHDLKIESVPEFLFANAKYAIPVRFSMKNIDKIDIKKVVVKFYPHEGAPAIEFETDSKFTADEGSEQGNGTSNDYFVHIDDDNFIKNIRLAWTEAGMVKDEAYFLLDVHYKALRDGESSGGVNGDPDMRPLSIAISDRDDDECKVKFFFDNTVPAYDIPVLVSNDDANTGQKKEPIPYAQDNVTLNNEGEKLAQIWDTETGAVIPGNVSDDGSHHWGLGPSYISREYIQESGDVDFGGSSGTVKGNRLSSVLIDDMDNFTAPPENGVKDPDGHSRIGLYGYSRGARFFLSYGGRNVDVLSKPTMANGLTITTNNIVTTNVDFRLYEFLEITTTTIKHGDGVDLEMVFLKSLYSVLDSTVGNVFKGAVPAAQTIAKTVKIIADTYHALEPSLNAASRSSKSNCYWSHQEHIYGAAPKITNNMISNYATKEVTSFGHQSTVFREKPCRVGREYIQTIIVSSEVEVFSDKAGKYGAETRTDLKAKDAKDWNEAKLIIDAQ